MKRAAKKSADPFPERISPQLAMLVSATPTHGAWTYEIKLDGYRILARCDGGDVRLFTRNENDWTSKDLRGLEFRQRRELLEALFVEHDGGRLRLAQTFDADGQSVLQSACKMGLEGVIAKRLDAPYKSARTDTWLKVKCQLRQEFVVGGFVTRTGTKREIGSLLLGVYDDEGRLRSVGSVGTGWDSKTAAAMLRTLEPLEIEKSAFDPEFAPTKGRWSRRPAGGERWVQPVVVVEVSFTEWTPDGHIRHPKFHGVRYDKPASEIRREAMQ